MFSLLDDFSSTANDFLRGMAGHFGLSRAATRITLIAAWLVVLLPGMFGFASLLVLLFSQDVTLGRVVFWPWYASWASYCSVPVAVIALAAVGSDSAWFRLRVLPAAALLMLSLTVWSDATARRAAGAQASSAAIKSILTQEWLRGLPRGDGTARPPVLF